MGPMVKHANPPLRSGDKLTRDEFLRRWDAHPEIKHAELIGGIVFMSSPVSVEHGTRENDMSGWLCFYKVATPGTDAGNNTTSLILDDTPQPDLYLRILPECGGSSWIEGKYLAGSPELLVEICWSSVAYDLHVKLDLYQEAKVPEYLAILLHEQEIRWHTLVNGAYQLLPPDANGIWRSRFFPGLWLDGEALLAGNLQQVLAKLQEGLATAEHQAFVLELARRRDVKRDPF